MVRPAARSYDRRMGIDAFTRARDRLIALSRRDADLTTVLNESLAALHSVTTFSWATIMTVDPQTLLPTTGVVEGFAPENCGPFWDTELLWPGFNKFTALARSNEVVATLHEATDGDLARSPLYTNVYEALGAADELRVAFLVGTTCWGVLAAVRAAADGPFPDDEVGLVRNLAPHIARALKAAVTKLEAESLGPPAMLVVRADNSVAHATAGARDVLADLHRTGVDEPDVPQIVAMVATRARTSRTSSHVATRVRANSGSWVRITAAPMEGSGDVAVMIEPARAADLTPILLEAYGLTDREVEIVLLLACGLATKEIATELVLSTHTVRDHIKAIFEKAGVNSRGELVARLFSEHLLESFHGAVHRAAPARVS